MYSLAECILDYMYLSICYTSSGFLIPISLQHNHVDLRDFKLLFLFDNNLSLKYQRFSPSGFEDLEIRKFESVAKTQLLC